MSLAEYLRSRDIPFVTLLHRPAPSAARLAQSLHTAGQGVAKAVLLRTGGWYVLAVLPATHRIDFPSLADALGVSGLELASENEVESVFADCERGALPPFGLLYRLTTVVDASLACQAEIVVEGNTRHEGIRLRYRDYETAAAPIRARFAEEICPARRKLARHAR
jgi:Ala-tRNA(Pro) deacylase